MLSFQDGLNHPPQLFLKIPKTMINAEIESPRRRSCLTACGPAVLILMGATICLLPVMTATPSEKLTRRAAHALFVEDYPEAERLAIAVLKETPDSTQALLIAGEAAVGLHEHDRAIRYFEGVTDSDPLAFVRAQFGKGERLLMLGRMTESEKCLRTARALNPRHFGASNRLSYLLQVQGRSWEALPAAKETIRHGRFRGDQLQMLGLTEMLFVSDPRFISLCLATVPSDPRPLLGEARRALLNNDVERAEKLLRKILAVDKNQIEAQSRLGRILLESNRSEEFLTWHAQLPTSAISHPEIWFNCGLWAQRQGEQRAAARCFLETVLRSPHHVSANYQLSLLMSALGDQKQADVFSSRADLLAKLELVFVGLYGDPALESMRRAVELLEPLGRYWEVAAMCDMALRLSPDRLEWATRGLVRASRRLEAGDSFVIADKSPIRDLDLSSYPLPDWDAGQSLSPAKPDRHADLSPVSFVDQATASGLKFTFYNGSKTPKGLEHIFETTGGGVAVMDYDGDFWPDLYFAQGGDLPPRTDDPHYRDRLFRNSGDGSFTDVTAQAGLGDHLFSQGVTVGDFNDDGFPDLYVANIGSNRFYENNGDGTFRDVTGQTDTGGNEWTLSCLLADLNGDALPDLYAVNYLVTQSVLDRSCRKNGKPLTCTPTMFPAEQDRLYLNLGDGRFEDVTSRSGIVHSEGKGLGIVAADFDGSGRLSLFIGNDTATNFLFSNQTPSRGGDIVFAETALLAGLGVDVEGRAQATMGIAAGDADGDGLLDLFATNFYSDANTLYLHQPGQMFADSTRQAGLRDPGYDLLGFGTQFLDGELDGFPDLVVTNGHVDRTEATREPDEMPPQYFQNLGKGRFVEASAQTLGAFFEGNYLGRSLTRLDWNRDGKEDFCIGHLHAPIALLTNQTEQTGHFLTIRLRGVDSARDAIGTVVQLHAGGQTWTQQLTAGDGYMSSNQRLLVFGLGSIDSIDRIDVIWPSGHEQTFRELAANNDLLFVEQRPEPVKLTGIR